jgi:hypothetical protein
MDLMNQTHLVEYINELNGFNFSYVRIFLMQGLDLSCLDECFTGILFSLCRGLIHQALTSITT